MKKLTLIGVLITFTIGCTYPLTITNEDSFISARTKPSVPVRIGFLNSSDQLINSVIEEMSLNAAVNEAKKDYQIGSAVEVDYVSDLSRNTKFRASGQNFLITFPGFLVFAHAWAGYKYYIDIDTQSVLMDAKGETLSKATITTNYEIRYTSFARGATSSLVGWIAPGLGTLDIIPGIYFSTDYDTRATADFIERVKPSYKAYVSSKVFEQIANSQVKPSSSNPGLFYRMEPQIIGDDFDENAVDNKFEVYVMKVEHGRLIMLTIKTVELSNEAQQTVNRIVNREIVPDAVILKKMFSSLAISDLPFSGDMRQVYLYTMQDDRMIPLIKGKPSGFQVADK